MRSFFSRAGLSLTVALVAVSAGGVPATAAEKIVFMTRPRDGKKPWAIAVMNADGSGRKVFTPDGKWENGSTMLEDQPALSPDGKRIAFRRGLEVWTMNSDGTGRKDIAWRNKGVTSPSWSPDGKRIAYSGYGRDVGDGFFGGSPETELKVIDADGKNRITLGKGIKGSSPSMAVWSPDGKRVLWRGPKLHVVDADGKNDRVPTDWRADDAAWSPDGKKILCISEELGPPKQKGSDFRLPEGPYLYVMDADGSNKKTLVKPKVGRGAWSPDGKRIAYLDVTGVGLYDVGGVGLYVCSSDGSEPKRLTDFANGVDILNGVDTLDHPRWSAGGKRIIFNRLCLDTKLSIKMLSICVIDADGKNYKELTPTDDLDALGYEPFINP
jgi:Tol biopolymer transport system component